MKTPQRLILIVGLSGATLLAGGKLWAQPGPGGPGGRNFDPAQFQKMMMDNYREQLEVKDDAEWKLIEQRIQKVMDARLQAGFGGGMGMVRMFGRGGQRGGGGVAGPGGGRRGFGAFAQPSPDEEALQTAVERKATNAELKAALAKFNEARKQKQAALEKAQAELRQVLSLRQEAIATLTGLL